MVANLPFNPMPTTVAGGTFPAGGQTVGYIQGVHLDDPATRFELAGGILNTSETLPMWGGVGIYELIPGAVGTPSGSLGGQVGRATSLTASAALSLTGFSVFNQDHSMQNFPQSPVPLAGSGMSVHFARLGSGLRVPVALNPALVNLEGQIITSQVSWDFTGQQLTQGQAAWAQQNLSALSWSSAGGGTLTGSTGSNHGVLVGSNFTIQNAVPAAYNGDYIALPGTTGTALVAALAANPGVAVTTGQLQAGGGFLNVKILDIQIANSMTVVYNPATGYATWNYAGSTALILL